MEVSPCKDCTIHTATCHGECVTYKEWAAAKRQERIETNRARASLDKMWNYGWRGGKK